MSLAAITNIEKTFGSRVLFHGLSLNIERGERIGLIGANGSGKTTLFRMLTGQIVPDAGVVFVSESAKLGHLTQDPVFTPGNSVIDEAELAFSALHDLAHRLRELEHAMAEDTGEALEKTLRLYQDVQHDFDVGGGYVWHHKLEATLLGVGLGRETWEQSIDTLSGGQRSRLALAKLLIAEPDLLLLDEPTNHLDLAAIDWLENYLLDFKGAVLLISHDRFLLDRLSTRIAWLRRTEIASYPGNYSAFVTQRDVEELTQQRHYEEQQADVEKQKEFIRRFGAGQRSKEAKGREKRLNRLLKSDAMINEVRADSKIKLALNTDQRAGDRVLSVKELSKGFTQKKLFDDLKFEVGRGERIGIIGPNGSGKTTLLRVLLGNEDADAGEIKWGANLNIGYYDQQLGDLDPESTVVEEAAEGRDARHQQVRNILAVMLFRGDDIHKPIKLLSGGERARVRLAQLLLDKPNVLLLDEPTNHLDIASCEGLENALRDFQGTILCVSHDRYFLDKTINRLLVLEPSGILDFEGNYSAWVKSTAVQKAPPPAPRKAKPAQQSQRAQAKPSKKPRGDNPYLRPFGKLGVKELEKQISQTEKDIADCQQTLANPSTFRNPARGREAQTQYDELAKKLEQLEAEYFERETS